MARERMVTRTISTTNVDAMCVDVTTAQVSICELSLTGTLTEEEALKQIKKYYETDTKKFVNVTITSQEEEIYGMLEADFLVHATKLDKETRKKLESEV